MLIKPSVDPEASVSCFVGWKHTYSLQTLQLSPNYYQETTTDKEIMSNEEKGKVHILTFHKAGIT